MPDRPSSAQRANHAKVLDCADRATTLSARSTGQLARFIATEGRFRGIKLNGKSFYDVLLQDLDELQSLIVEMKRLDAEDALESSREHDDS